MNDSPDDIERRRILQEPAAYRITPLFHRLISFHPFDA